MKVRRFLSSAAFLAVSGMIAKGIGALYKVPMVTVLGAEGMGLYQLVFPMYTVLLTISSGGVPLAVARSVARARAAGEDAGAVILWSVLSFAAAGLLGSFALAFFGSAMAGAQGNADAAPAYVALAPSVLLVSVLAVLRGLWQGSNDMFPTAMSQLVEQTVKLGAGLWLASALMPMGVPYGVAGAVGGITVSELFALAAVCVLTLVRRGKTRRTRPYAPARDVLPDLWACALPVSFGSLVMPLLQLVDSVTVVNLLVLSGESVTTATSLFGAATAPVFAIVNLPTVITSAACASALPRLSAAVERGERTDDISDGVLRAAHVAGMGGGAFIALFADSIVSSLFSGGLTPAETSVAAEVLRISAAGVPYVCYMQAVTVWLQAHGRAGTPALCLLAGGALKTILTAVLVPLTGVTGSAYATVAAYALTFALDALATRRSFGMTVRPMLSVLAATAAATVAGGAVSCLVRGGIAGLILPPAAFGSVYLLGVLLAGVGSEFSFGALREKIARALTAQKTKKY